MIDRTNVEKEEKSSEMSDMFKKIVQKIRVDDHEGLLESYEISEGKQMSQADVNYFHELSFELDLHPFGLFDKDPWDCSAIDSGPFFLASFDKENMEPVFFKFFFIYYFIFKI